MWPRFQQQGYGRSRNQHVDHMYLQFTDVQNNKVTFSFPGAPDYGRMDARIAKNEDISPLF